MGELIVQEEAGSVANPSAGKRKLYPKSDGWYERNSAGVEVGPFSTGGNPDSIRTRYIITPSVVSNNLTVAIKYIDGNNPTSTNKITFRVGNTEYSLTAAMSFTKNAATNWMNMGSAEIATQDVDLFVYAIGETGASAGLKFGYSRIPYATTMGDFVNMTTNEKYIAGNWTNFNSTDAVRNIGRFRARLSAGAGYTWSIPTANVINYPIYETGTLAWTPAYSASGSMTFGTVTTNRAVYRIVGRLCLFTIGCNGTTGGTASVSLLFTFPFTVLSNSGVGVGAVVNDAGGFIAGQFFPNTTTQGTFRKYDGSNWGLGANRQGIVSTFYEV